MSVGPNLSVEAAVAEGLAPRAMPDYPPADGPVPERRDHRWGRSRAVALLIASVLFVGLGVVGAARDIGRYALYRGFTPIVVPSWIHLHTTVRRFWVRSPAIGGRTQAVYVVLPPGYAQHPTRRYPVLYLLHGFPEVPTAFLNVGQVAQREDILVAHHRMRGLILVMPSGTSSFFTDEEWANGVGVQDQWETFVARDVVRSIDRRFRTIPSGGGRGIGGLSSGGYGALNIGFHHPGEFHVIESWSGYTHASGSPSIYGTDPARIAYNSPARFIPYVAARLRMAHTFIWFYIGARDEGLPRNAEFARELSKFGIRHHFFTVTARHDWAAWRPNVPAALMAASSHLLAPITPTATGHAPLQVKLPRRAQHG
jgi:enterochelin esterase-like enzyme